GHGCVVPGGRLEGGGDAKGQHVAGGEVAVVDPPVDAQHAEAGADRGAHPVDAGHRARGQDHVPVPGGRRVGRDAGEVAVHPVEYRAVGVVVEREHLALGAVGQVHDAVVDRAVRADRVPALPHGGGATVHLVQPGRQVVAQQHQV